MVGVRSHEVGSASAATSVGFEIGVTFSNRSATVSALVPFRKEYKSELESFHPNIID